MSSRAVAARGEKSPNGSASQKGTDMRYRILILSLILSFGCVNPEDSTVQSLLACPAPQGGYSPAACPSPEVTIRFQGEGLLQPGSGAPRPTLTVGSDLVPIWYFGAPEVALVAPVSPDNVLGACTVTRIKASVNRTGTTSQMRMQFLNITDLNSPPINYGTVYSSTIPWLGWEVLTWTGSRRIPSGSPLINVYVNSDGGGSDHFLRWVDVTFTCPN